MSMGLAQQLGCCGLCLHSAHAFDRFVELLEHVTRHEPGRRDSGAMVHWNQGAGLHFLTASMQDGTTMHAML
jgi:hypothetical protein